MSLTQSHAVWEDHAKPEPIQHLQGGLLAVWMAKLTMVVEAKSVKNPTTIDESTMGRSTTDSVDDDNVKVGHLQPMYCLVY